MGIRQNFIVIIIRNDPLGVRNVFDKLDRYKRDLEYCLRMGSISDIKKSCIDTNDKQLHYNVNIINDFF